MSKENGLLVRTECLKGFTTLSKNEIQSTIQDYKFEFNNVKDENFEK